MDGVELARQVGLLRPELPVILMSARTEALGRGAANDSHRQFFSKPFNSHELLEAVAVAVGH